MPDNCMIQHPDITSTELLRLIRKGYIAFGGNNSLKIYGRLNCQSGKRMKNKHRIFFVTEEEAIAAGFRPCGNCMRVQYKNRKRSII